MGDLAYCLVGNGQQFHKLENIINFLKNHYNWSKNFFFSILCMSVIFHIILEAIFICDLMQNQFAHIACHLCSEQLL